jgi:hypothetical protein
MVVKFTYNISKVFNNAGFLVERGESFVMGFIALEQLVFFF